MKLSESSRSFSTPITFLNNNYDTSKTKVTYIYRSRMHDDNEDDDDDKNNTIKFKAKHSGKDSSKQKHKHDDNNTIRYDTIRVYKAQCPFFTFARRTLNTFRV